MARTLARKAALLDLGRLILVERRTLRWRETDSKFQYRAKSTTPCVIRDGHDRLSAVRSEQPQSLPSVRLSGKKCGSAAWARATNSATAPCDGNIPILVEAIKTALPPLSFDPNLLKSGTDQQHAARCHRQSGFAQIEFATDSPLERDGFEISVPHERR